MGKRGPAVSAAKPSAMIRYTALRLLIFFGCFFAAGVAVHFGLGALRTRRLQRRLGDPPRPRPAPLSYVLLRKQRDEMSEQIITTVYWNQLASTPTAPARTPFSKLPHTHAPEGRAM
ncbi:hypothetical protein SMICM17S_00840 [Streptomyces microflavus]